MMLASLVVGPTLNARRGRQAIGIALALPRLPEFFEQKSCEGKVQRSGRAMGAGPGGQAVHWASISLVRASGCVMLTL